MNKVVKKLGTVVVVMLAWMMLFVLFPNNGLFLKNSLRGWVAMSVFILPILMYGVNSLAWLTATRRGAYNWRKMLEKVWPAILWPIIITGIFLAYHYMCGSHQVPYEGLALPTPCA